MPPADPRTLREILFEEPEQFDFYQAVRLLEMAAAGEDAGAGMDPVRFRASLDLAFPPAPVVSLKPGDPPEMTVSFLSLGGAQGPLPGSIVEDILDRVRAGDNAFAHFLDLFHHRLIALAYRIRKKHRAALASGWPEHTAVAGYLLALAGLGLEELREKTPVPDRAFIRYAGILWARPRSAASLAAMLADYFAVPVTVRQFTGDWQELPESQWTILGGPNARNERLGGATCGTRVWDQHAGVTLEIGPLERDAFDSFLPGGRAYEAATVLSRLFLGERPRIDLHLVLRAAGVSPGGLGSSRLGLTSWLQAGSPPAADDTQVRIRLAARA